MSSKAFKEFLGVGAIESKPKVDLDKERDQIEQEELERLVKSNREEQRKIKLYKGTTALIIDEINKTLANTAPDALDYKELFYKLVEANNLRGNNIYLNSYSKSHKRKHKAKKPEYDLSGLVEDLNKRTEQRYDGLREIVTDKQGKPVALNDEDAKRYHTLTDPKEIEDLLNSVDKRGIPLCFRGAIGREEQRTT